jgi:hypothetical protein
MSSIEFDASDLQALADDLTAAERVPGLEAVMHRAANNIKRTMREDATGHRHLPGLPSTVNYDLESDADSVDIEVGFDKKGQGNLANIAAFGSVNNAPVMDITRGLRIELPALEAWLGDLATRWTK